MLILLNQDMLDVGDLQEAYTGQMVYGNGVFSYVNTVSKGIVEGRIQDEKDKIDLYIWIDRKQTTETFFRPVSHTGRDLACKFFGAPPLADHGSLGVNEAE